MQEADTITQAKSSLPVTIFRQLGPGLVTGAADDDPSGIATYGQVGAQFALRPRMVNSV